VAEIKRVQDAGMGALFKGNAYAEDLKSGDAVISMAWSGDMVQALLDKPTLRFTIATEGGNLWTDNCMIPKAAAHAYTAEVMIDYCYDPKVAAQIEAYVNYICPVKGAAEALKAKDPDVANNPLIFPPAETFARLHIFGSLNEADEKYFNDKFAKVLGV
jgi:spermidine/putrescine transport system substrate-binding protein